jgi:hypothetical protein
MARGVTACEQIPLDTLPEIEERDEQINDFGTGL